MGNVPLLSARGGEAGKTREVIASALELSEGLGYGLVVEEIVDGKLLRGGELVVHANGELIHVIGPARNRG